MYDVKGLPKLGPQLEYKNNRLLASKITAEKTGKRPTASVRHGPLLLVLTELLLQGPHS